jgi:hypothetical protein
MADLEYLSVAGGKQPLHMQLRGSGKEPAFRCEGRNMLLGSNRLYTERCFYLKETFAAEEVANTIEDQRAEFEIVLKAREA